MTDMQRLEIENALCDIVLQGARNRQKRKYAQENQEADQKILRTYKIDTKCTNCSYSYEIQVPKGTKLIDFFSDHICPKCECNA